MRLQLKWNAATAEPERDEACMVGVSGSLESYRTGNLTDHLHTISSCLLSVWELLHPVTRNWSPYISSEEFWQRKETRKTTLHMDLMSSLGENAGSGVLRCGRPVKSVWTEKRGREKTFADPTFVLQSSVGIFCPCFCFLVSCHTLRFRRSTRTIFKQVFWRPDKIWHDLCSHQQNLSDYWTHYVTWIWQIVSLAHQSVQCGVTALRIWKQVTLKWQSAALQLVKKQ